MSQTTARGIAYTRVLSEARKQLDTGTEVDALIDAAGDLREFDPNDPLVTALEARIRRAAQIRFMAIRAKLVERGNAQNVKRRALAPSRLVTS